MKVVIDIEANSLTNPTKIWCVVCKDIDTGQFHIFREVNDDLISFINSIEMFVGHNFLDYDYPVLCKLCNISIPDIAHKTVDTYIVSKMVNYSRSTGHSIRSYGEEFNLEKLEHNDFTKWSPEMEAYCERDVEISHRIYLKYLDVLSDPVQRKALELEQAFQAIVVNSLHNNGFSFNVSRAESLLSKVKLDLAVLDEEIKHAFPPKLKPIREISPKTTKYGSLNRSDFRWYPSDDLSEFNGFPFLRCSWTEFNPASHRQIVEVLSQAGWKPTERTATHIAFSRLKEQDPIKLEHFKKFGWKVNEENLSTLPPTAPSPARLLAKRILLESRRRTLTEWLAIVSDNSRIHGKFIGIGAWTHRMAHQEPNTANIPNEHNINGTKKLLGKELRALWQAPPKRLLVGVDAEGIQLRIFAHYINEPEFTEALVNGRKENKTDPHSLNQRILGPVCRSRAAAKRFIYALLLGAGIGKLAQILECDERAAKEALDRLIKRYRGFGELKRTIIPADARRGYFEGLDGRRVQIPGDTVSERRHLCMSGYLQNGEAVIMKMACLRWHDVLLQDKALLVNFVHDEWQTECPNNMEVALRIAARQALSLREVGEELGLKCPLAGSYWNEDKKDYTIGVNWSVTH